MNYKFSFKYGYSLYAEEIARPYRNTELQGRTIYKAPSSARVGISLQSRAITPQNRKAAPNISIS